MEILEIVMYVVGTAAVTGLTAWNLVLRAQRKSGNWVEAFLRELPAVLSQLGSLLNMATETYRIAQQHGGPGSGTLEKEKLALDRLKAEAKSELDASRNELKQQEIDLRQIIAAADAENEKEKARLATEALVLRERQLKLNEKKQESSNSSGG